MLIMRPVSIQNHGYQVEVPDKCPQCHHHSEMKFIQGDLINNKLHVQAIFRCEYSQCRSFFFCYYGPKPDGKLLQVQPIKPDVSSFPEAVSEISPTFISIFKEAEEAAALGLKQIAGPGYRKAFEFLIKDYAKYLSPGKDKEIEEAFSGKIVDQNVEDQRIKSAAKRCLWLGNDETHYLRKWGDKDMNDLVKLIKLTAAWIEIEHISKSYDDEMPD